MAVRPRRADPISTRPLYLPRIRVPQRQPDLPADLALDRPFAEPLPAGQRACYLYADGPGLGLDLNAVAGRLQQARPGLKTSPLGELLPLALHSQRHLQRRHAVAELADALARAVVSDHGVRGHEEPVHGDIEREKALLGAHGAPAFMDAALWQASAAARRYDGLRVQQALARILPQGWQGHGRWHVVLTGRRLALWDEGAGRWAPAAAVPGLPTLVSLFAEPGGAASPEEGAARTLGELLAA